jgi:hypothetical protein
MGHNYNLSQNYAMHCGYSDKADNISAHCRFVSTNKIKILLQHALNSEY